MGKTVILAKFHCWICRQSFYADSELFKKEKDRCSDDWKHVSRFRCPNCKNNNLERITEALK